MASNGRLASRDDFAEDAFSEELITACETFVDDPLGFVYWAFPWNDPEYPELCPRRHENEPMGPDAWQVEFLYDLGERLKRSRNAAEGDREAMRSIRKAATSGHGAGKEQDVDEPVMTPHGWRRIGDLRVGDLVATVDGTFTRVTGVYPQGVKRMFRVVMADGGWTWAGAEHLWWTTTRSERKHGKEGRARTTAEIAESLTFSNGPSLGLNHQIPTASAIRHIERDLPVDPYFLGCWLGDGHRTAQRMALMTIGADKVAALEAAGARIRQVPGLPNSFQAKLTPADADGLRELGVLGTHSYDRFVPDIYLRASIGQREALLQGLLDTDGTVSHNGVSLTTTSPRLRDHVAELCRSLGGVARVSQPFQKNYPHNGEIRTGRTAWRVHLSLPDDVRPFRNAAKAEKYQPTSHKNRQRALARFIERVEPGEMREAVCIQVEHPTHLYVTRDHIVTHNTVVTCWLILWFLSCRSHPIVTVTANTASQLSGTTWRTLAKWKRWARTGPWFEWTATKLAHIAFPDTWYAAAVPWSANNPEAFAGKHEGNLLLIFDESSGIDDIIWETAEGQMTTHGAIWLAFGNGTRNTGRFYEITTRFRNQWDHMSVDTRDCRFSNKAEIDEWLEAYGEDSDFFRVRVKGEYPRSNYNALFSVEAITRAGDEFKRRFGPNLKRKLALDGLTALAREMRHQARGMPLILSVDVARMGGDQSVIGLRCGNIFFCPSKFREMRSHQLVGQIAHHIQAVDPEMTFVDGGGYGAAICDELENLGFNIERVMGGNPSSSPREFFNRRAEMYKRAEIWMTQGGMIDWQDKDLNSDLREIQIGWAKKTECLQLETKELMRKRGVASPDTADTLAQTFYQPVVLRRGAEERSVAEELAELAAGGYGGSSQRTWKSN